MSSAAGDVGLVQRLATDGDVRVRRRCRHGSPSWASTDGGRGRGLPAIVGELPTCISGLTRVVRVGPSPAGLRHGVCWTPVGHLVVVAPAGPPVGSRAARSAVAGGRSCAVSLPPPRCLDARRRGLRSHADGGSRSRARGAPLQYLGHLTQGELKRRVGRAGPVTSRALLVSGRDDHGLVAMDEVPLAATAQGTGVSVGDPLPATRGPRARPRLTLTAVAARVDPIAGWS